MRNLEREIASVCRKLARVALDEQHQRVMREVDLEFLEPVFFNLTWHQEQTPDLQFLLMGVAGQLDHFHAVEQGRRDRVCDVRGADEKDLRQIVLDIEVVIVEGMVLFGVENLEQGAGGVAAKIGRHFVDLVEKQHRVDGAGLAHHLDDLARKGTDISAPVATDFRLVSHSAKRKSDKLPTGCARDRPRERGLAGAGRAGKTQDCAGRFPHQLTNGEEFENPVFDLFQPVVVVVQHLFSPTDVSDFTGGFFPRNRKQPVDVVAGNAGLCGDRRHALESSQLDLRLLFGLLAHAALFNLVFELFEFFGVVVAAELFVDRMIFSDR